MTLSADTSEPIDSRDSGVQNVFPDDSVLPYPQMLNLAVTGAKRMYIWDTDTMSGINWCQVPVTIVEMGFMSNPEEDQKMATDAYQQLLALGIANGIERYFESIG